MWRRPGRRRPLAVLATLAALAVPGCALPIIGAHPAPRVKQGHSPATQRAPRSSAPAADTADTTPATSLAPRPPRSAKACYDRLWKAGSTFELVRKARARGVRMPIRVTGRIGGVQVLSRGGRDVHEIIDCRLALQILAWAPALRAAGVDAIEHYSVYRPGARTRRGKRSGHASGLAIDVAAYRMSDGSVVDVLTDWEERDRDEPPCPRRPHEAWGSRVLRGTVCEAVDDALFSVVLTPHHDDAHQNHVHLELKVGTDWTYVK